MSLLIGQNSVVSMHYTLSDGNGNVLDSSDGGEPLTYLHGAGNIVPGLEDALTGKSLGGDSLKIQVNPEDGYGEVVPELIQTVERAAFDGVDSVEEGMAFEAQSPEGQTQRIIVKKVEGDQITIDANHPLAGEVLHFNIEIVGVRDASQEEIEHGHAH